MHSWLVLKDVAYDIMSAWKPRAFKSAGSDLSLVEGFNHEIEIQDSNSTRSLCDLAMRHWTGGCVGLHSDNMVFSRL